MEPKRAKVVTPAKFRHLLRVTEATSRFPERDTLVLLLGITCGMRVTEIARIEIRDVLARSGGEARRSQLARLDCEGLPASMYLPVARAHH